MPKDWKSLEELMGKIDEKALYWETGKNYFQWIKSSEGPTLVFYTEDMVRWLLESCDGSSEKAKEMIHKIFKQFEAELMKELGLDQIISKRNSKEQMLQHLLAKNGEQGEY